MRVFVGIVLASAAPGLGQAPAARLAAPVAPASAVIRGSDPDPFMDGPRLPAARLGTITSARIGEAPDSASPEERYNWGAPRDRRASPAARSRDRDRAPDRDADRDRDLARNDSDYDRRGARLREPAAGQLTFGKRRGEPVPVADPGPAPAWWPDREQNLNDLRDTLPPFGEPRGGADRDRDRIAFGSDCAFNEFISPMSNPFLAEDPRSLTELRPVFIYQTIPGSHPLYQGGSVSFLGVQARAALTDRFSVVLHKLGWMNFSPGSGSGLPSETGFAEIWLSPKFVFWRDPDNQVLASFGMQFQLPTGPSTVFQDTGTLSVVPYLSFGARAGQMTFGTFHFMNIGGYSFSTGTERSDYFYDTIHLDLDAGDFHRFYPLVELNWFHYTTNGTSRPAFNFEGRDLANMGSSAAGQNLVSIAAGFRYKFTETLHFGAAAEFPLAGSGTSTFQQFRLGIDFIWRY